MKFASRASFAMTPLSAALLLASSNVLAAGQATPTNAGALLQELQPAAKRAPSPRAPAVKIESNGAAGLPASAPFVVKRIRITGNTAFDAATLHALLAEQEGKTLTLRDLDELAGRITKYYQEHGFPLARAIIPAQTVSDGTVEIAVVEARYGDIHLNNSSQVGDPLIASTLAPLQKDQAVSERDLNRALLLLSDVPGVGVNAVLRPGAAVGTSDLVVDTTPTVPSGNGISLDNYGNRYVGRARVSGAATIYNPLHHGDALSANVISTGQRMSYGRVGYDTLLDGQGTHVGAAYSMVYYKLGGSASSLDAHGTAGVASLWAKYPFARSKQYNLRGQVQFDAKKLQDHIDSTNVRTDRHLANLVLSVSGDMRDALLGGGVSAWGIGWTGGHVGFDDTAAAAADAATAQTRGRYSKWNLNVSRLQGLTRSDSLYATFAWQKSNANLDSAEKMSAGGPYSVRAYDIGAVSSDTGYFVSIELRHDLGQLAGGALQAQIFGDSAHVNINRSPWVKGENGVTLSGVGVGVRWSGASQWEVSASLATQTGSRSRLVASDGSTRAWIVASKGF